MMAMSRFAGGAERQAPVPAEGREQDRRARSNDLRLIAASREPCPSPAAEASWSTTTAATMTSPLITICQNSETPSSTSPSLSTPITNAPTSVPPMLPRPPDSEVPPRTTAAIAESSNVSPVAGCAACS